MNARQTERVVGAEGVVVSVGRDESSSEREWVKCSGRVGVVEMSHKTHPPQPKLTHHRQ